MWNVGHLCLTCLIGTFIGSANPFIDRFLVHLGWFCRRMYSRPIHLSQYNFQHGSATRLCLLQKKLSRLDNRYQGPEIKLELIVMSLEGREKRNCFINSFLCGLHVTLDKKANDSNAISQCYNAKPDHRLMQNAPCCYTFSVLNVLYLENLNANVQNILGLY